MRINEFYANREVFITGGTGFLGKALIEKILRDCSKIKVIYILLRGKKSLSAEQRLDQLKQDKVFYQLHQKCPEILNKLHAIQGDSQELGLGIQPNDLKLLKNISAIFHMAANVKFDAPFRNSILLNTRGTYELVKIAENLKNLVVFMHCSTAFCNPLEEVLEERIYKIPADWRKTIKMAETYDEGTLNTLFNKFTGFYPNTYTFTKNLSEQIIQEYSTKLPMIIFRPSVVVGAYKEPMVGWIDNINGPIASMVAHSIGILPISYCNGSIMLDFIPIDFVTKLTLVAAYKRGMQMLRKEPIPNGIEVVNCASFELSNVNMFGATAVYAKAVQKNPVENCIWNYDYPILTSCYYNFLLQQLLLSVPLALIIDAILRFVGRKPLMMKLARRIIYSTDALMFFTLKDYKIINANMLDLENIIPEGDIASYGVKRDFVDMNVTDYMEKALDGVKYYFFNQPMQATDAARKRAKILFIVSRSIKFLMITLFVLYLWSFVSKF